MVCAHCDSSNTRPQKQKTNLGYKQYYCRRCQCQFNERTGTSFNYLEYPTEIVIMAVIYYYQFKTSLDDVVKLMLMRGIDLSHQTVQNWATTIGIELALEFRSRRCGTAGKKWHADAVKPPNLPQCKSRKCVSNFLSKLPRSKLPKTLMWSFLIIMFKPIIGDSLCFSNTIKPMLV